MDRQFTKNGFYNAVIAKINGEEIEEIWTDEALVEYATNEINKIAAANMKAAEKRAEKAAENDELKNDILARLSASNLKTASEIGAELEISTQKASAMLVQLEKAGVVASKEVRINNRKAKGYFLVENENED